MNYFLNCMTLQSYRTSLTLLQINMGFTVSGAIYGKIKIIE